MCRKNLIFEGVCLKKSGQTACLNSHKQRQTAINTLGQLFKKHKHPQNYRR